VVLAAELEIDLAQFLERAVHADLHGADGGVEQAGDLAVFDVLQAGEDEHLAVLERHAGEGGAEEFEVVGRGGVVIGRGAFVGVGVEIGGIGGRGGAGVFAEVVGGDLAGEVVEPGGELALVAVGVAVFEDPVEDDLHEVLAEGGLVGHPHEEGVEPLLVALEQLAEPGDLAGADRDHDFVVGGFHRGGDASHDGDGGNPDFGGRWRKEQHRAEA